MEETLKPCLNSIIKYTDLEETEIIVVANGCTDDTGGFVAKLHSQYPSIHMVWAQDPLGYTKAVNIGMEQAKGEFLVLLNNDTQILESPKNQWLEVLNEPFKANAQKVGITGPMKVNSPQTDREFLIFFCVMIGRECYETLGPLDEIFSPGYGEDTDYCHKAEDAGFQVLQVPQESKIYYGHNRMTGNFPIWHEGNVTFKNWPGGEDLLAKNNEILEQRYKYKIDGKTISEHIHESVVDRVHTGTDAPIFDFERGEQPLVYIEKALKCDGYMSDVELKWLGQQAQEAMIFIEIGSWHGRSTRAIADNLPRGAKLYAIDHWLGSAVERDTNHASAAMKEGDHAYLEFCDNLFDHIQSGKVIPLRMSGNNAAEFLSSKGIKGDVIFIDAGHTYDEVKEDVAKWKPLVKNGGLLCGHDYYHDGTAWPGVQQAVDEIFGHKGTNMGYIYSNSIWAHKIELKQEVNEAQKPDIYDCFPFNNELEILERRFSELYDVVDRFVIVEATKTHGGEDKSLYFRDNLQRYEKYLNKVTHIIVDDYPQVPDNATVTDKSWTIERHQRECIMRGLTNCKEMDIIIISDADEIPDRETIKHILQNRLDTYSSSFIANLEMDLYYYNENTKAKDKWKEAKVATYDEVKRLGPCGIRYSTPNVFTYGNAGKHLSYFGDVGAIIKKIQNTAHQEYNNEYMKNPDRIRKAIAEGKDVFGRDNIQFEKVGQNIKDFAKLIKTEHD